MNNLGPKSHNVQMPTANQSQSQSHTTTSTTGTYAPTATPWQGDVTSALLGNLNGDYLNSQPANDYISAQVRRQLPALTAGLSSTGNLYSSNLGLGLGQITSDAAANLYNQERGRQLQAAGLLPLYSGGTTTGTGTSTGSTSSSGQSIGTNQYYTNPAAEGLGLLGAGASLFGGLGGLGGFGGGGGFGDVLSGTLGGPINAFGPLASIAAPFTFGLL